MCGHPTASYSIEFDVDLCDPCYGQRLVSLERTREAAANAACGQSVQTIRAKRRSGEWPEHPR